MKDDRLRDILERFRSGTLGLDAAVDALTSAETPASVSLSFATVDLERLARQGRSEVIFGEGKSPEQIAKIAGTLLDAGQTALATRVDAGKASEVIAREPRLVYEPLPRLLIGGESPKSSQIGRVSVVAAGTSDLGVAEEAARVVEFHGVAVERVYDVGVAGLHRLLSALPRIETANVVIAVAGMEGALPSVLGGLIRAPLIAVPTSVGYGAAFSGVAALCGMLTGCAAGTSVVNIDNGFGAAIAALKILEVGRGLAEDRGNLAESRTNLPH